VSANTQQQRKPMIELPTLITAALEQVINRVLRLDPEAQRGLAKLAGKVIAIEVRGFDSGFYLTPGPDGVQVMSHYEGQADTTLSGTPLGLMRIGVARDATEVLFAGDVEISGDVEYGRRFREFLGRLDIDWEEQLSKITGDILARQIGNVVRGAARWSGNAADALQRNTADYLHYETRAVPTRHEVDAFMHEVDTLRSDLDRLAARIERLGGVNKIKNNKVL
jgi:ubiquinone biosynthesis protein UbiJ